MTGSPFDFRSPPPGELERQTAGWLAAACRRAGPAWRSKLPYAAEMRPGTVETVTMQAGLSRIAATDIAIPMTSPDAADGTVLLAMSRSLLLALLNGILGETPTALPADRDLTQVERSLIGHVARELFLDHIAPTWPGAEPLHLVAGTAMLGSEIRPVQPGDMALLATLTIVTPFGEQPATLVLPRTGRWERLVIPPRTERPVARDPAQIAALVREMPVELAVVLGTTELTMSELAHLRSGDVVVLRQKVAEPLEGLIAGERKFRVWPGAIGHRAAIQVHGLADG
jgi:flagellar motor switch protein FliM